MIVYHPIILYYRTIILWHNSQVNYATMFGLATVLTEQGSGGAVGCSVFFAKNHRENGAKPKLSFVLWFEKNCATWWFFFSENDVLFWFTTFSGKWTGTGHRFHRLLWIFMAQRVGSYYDTIAGWLHALVARKRTKKSKRWGTATIKGWVILRLWVFWVCLEQFSSG